MKRHISIGFITFFIISIFMISDKVLADINDNLILHYDFNKVKDGVVKDISKNRKDGVIQGKYSSLEDNQMGEILSLDGQGVIKLPESLFKGNEKGITIATWVKFSEDNRKFSEMQKVFDFGLDNKNYFSLGKNRSIYLNKNSQESGILQDNSYTEEQWIHVALTLNNEGISYYENGIKILSNSKKYNLQDIIKFNENYIGKSKYSTDPWFKGQICQFKIYNKALAKDEIEDEMFSNINEGQALNVIKDSLFVDGLESVKNNIVLPSQLYDDVKISWTSDKEGVISSNGKVNRPKSGEKVEVILKATLIKGEQSATKNFSAYVLPENTAEYTLNIFSKEHLESDNNNENKDKDINYYINKYWGEKVIAKKLENKFVNTKLGDTKDISGGISLGANKSFVQYDDIVVKNNNNGKIIFEDDFSTIKEDWRIINGNWKVENNSLFLDEGSQDYRIYLDKKWTNYTVELKVKKISGENGFSVGVGYSNKNNYYSFTVGDKNNKKVIIDKVIDNNKTTVNKSKVDVSLTNGKEYKLKIIVKGKNIKSYIDGKLTNDYKEKTSEEVVTSVGYDNNKKDIIIGLMNKGDEGKEIIINANELGIAGSNAEIQYIDFSSLKNEENEKVNIKKKTINNLQESFSCEINGNSVSIIRIKNGSIAESKEEDNASKNSQTLNKEDITKVNKNYLLGKKEQHNYLEVVLGFLGILIIVIIVSISRSSKNKRKKLS